MSNAPVAVALRASEALRQVAALCMSHGFVIPAELTEALERARVVGVLDAWAIGLGGHADSIRAAGWSSLASGSPGKIESDKPTCWLYYEEWSGEDDGYWVAKEKLFDAATPDAARAAAAKAIESGEV